MDIVFTQTADPHNYLDLLTATSRTVRAYCDRHACEYESYVGVKRGYWPWQASFNRIYMLQELADRGRHDWAVYMDADAFVADLRFDLRDYLMQHRTAAAVMVRSGVTDYWWDVNDGVLLLNLHHPVTHRLLEHWRASYEAISEETLRGWTTWSNPDDQEMLHAFMYSNEEVRSDIVFAPPSLMNSSKARFIQQMLRAAFSDPEGRLRALRARVDAIMAAGSTDQEHEPAADDEAAHAFIDKVYRAVLRRGADSYGLDHFGAIFSHLGFEGGTRFLVDGLLASGEYAALNPPVAEPPVVEPSD